MWGIELEAVSGLLLIGTTIVVGLAVTVAIYRRRAARAAAAAPTNSAPQPADDTSQSREAP